MKANRLQEIAGITLTIITVLLILVYLYQKI